jgi:hypothetical protein
MALSKIHIHLVCNVISLEVTAVTIRWSPLGFISTQNFSDFV